MGCTRNDNLHQMGILMGNMAHYIFRHAICRQNHTEAENMGFNHKTRSHLACTVWLGRNTKRTIFGGWVNISFNLNSYPYLNFRQGPPKVWINLVRKPKSSIFTASYSLILMLSS